MSVITYNTITLPLAEITDFSQEVVLDPSNTDWYCTRLTVAIQSILNVNYASTMIGRDIGTSSPADIMNYIKSLLLQQRKQLSVKFNGIELIPKIQEGMAGTVDAQNGPHPQYCNLAQLTDTTFIMTYKIIAHYWENPLKQVDHDPLVKNIRGNNVLYNRWSESVAIDDRDISTRTRAGKIIIRSDNSDGLIADKVRTQMAVVGVPYNFLRQSSNYTVSEDGLGLAYTLVDKEVYKHPPKPAFKAEGYYSEAVNRMAALVYGKVHVALKGNMDGRQSDLLSAAMLVASRKLIQRGAQRAPFSILESASVSVDLYDNTATCEIAMMRGRTKGRKQLLPFAGMSTVTPLSEAMNSQTQPDYHVRGTAGLLLRAAAYYDPSLETTKLKDISPTFFSDNPLVRAGRGLGEGQLDAGKEVGTEGKNP